MNANRGVKRKRGLVKPHQPKAQLSPEEILPGKLHHSLQEFKRLAKHTKVNETQIIVKKLKSLCSSSDGAGTAKRDSTKSLQDLEVQLVALKSVDLTHFAAAALIQKLNRNRTLSADKTVSGLVSTVPQPSFSSPTARLNLTAPRGKPEPSDQPQVLFRTRIGVGSTLRSQSPPTSLLAIQLPPTSMKKSPTIELGTETGKTISSIKESLPTITSIN